MQDWWENTFPKGRQMLTITDANEASVQIAYGEKGTGKPLILVHGIASWSYSWRHTIAPLAEHFRVFCIDAKGHGFSDKPLSPDKIGHQIIELQRIIEALCDEPVTIIAQSLGALISLALVQQKPELCDRLVLINVPIFLNTLPTWWMQFLAYLPLELVQFVDRSRLLKKTAPLARGITGYFRREVVADPALINPTDVYWITYPYIEMEGAIAKYAEDIQLSIKVIQGISSDPTNFIRTVRENLANTHTPCLILWGDRDRWFPSSHGEQLHQCLPNSQFKLLKNCGHDASGSCSEQVNLALLDFLL
ncbi:alpha/beta hydrolase [Spirulina sp. 06S082]|uniref:alpha/beta fold hydrolase n=1 Tax=Spirulina sp. 06S082 TaxID=3110248 RepID=UPI002B220B21|nr:alpha/beta hydrolase [Spirulina sp. 06S082]MEA5471806.1 alpha/beta hydrolase [Spirulina sp. 06S082]